MWTLQMRESTICNKKDVKVGSHFLYPGRSLRVQSGACCSCRGLRAKSLFQELNLSLAVLLEPVPGVNIKQEV